MMSRLIGALIALILPVPFGISGSTKSDDAKKIHGTWQVVSLTLEGRQRSAEDIKNLRYKISPTEIAMVQGDKDTVPPRKYSIKPDKTPKQIDIVDIIYSVDKKSGKESEEKLVMPGIYELDKDTLKICWNGEGVPPEKLERPTEFKAVGKTSLVILKRQK